MTTRPQQQTPPWTTNKSATNLFMGGNKKESKINESLLV